MQVSKGQKLKVSDIVNDTSAFYVEITTNAAFTVDYSCFGLDHLGNLSDERYMTFFNQPKTPCSSIELIDNKHNNAKFKINLDRIPVTIHRLVFIAAIDGQETMSQIFQGSFKILTKKMLAFEQEVLAFPLIANDYNQERAIIVSEFYRKYSLWRFSAVGQGFNGGLDAVVKHFGGTVAEDTPVIRQSSIKQHISLEKKISTDAPQLVSLAKKAQVILEKKKLTEVQAQVALVLDASWSMFRQYGNGTIQEVIDRILPLAVHFDDDGDLDCWVFGTKAKKIKSVNLKNVGRFIENEKLNSYNTIKKFGGGNDEPVAIKMVTDYYKKSGFKLPAYVVFISDGGVGNDREIEKLLKEASSLPIFWQFVGIGGYGYGILERLDTMQGRVVDNCNFFSLDDLKKVNEQELYDRLLNEFPDWLSEAKSKGILS